MLSICIAIILFADGLCLRAGYQGGRIISICSDSRLTVDNQTFLVVLVRKCPLDT